MKTHVAAYGTLRKGQGNWRWFLSGHSNYLGTHKIRGFRMVTNGSYPYVYEDDGEVTIDLFEIPTPVIDDLDGLEGYPHHYNRKIIDIASRKAWIYFTEDRSVLRLEKVPTGDWLDYIRNTHQTRRSQ